MAGAKLPFLVTFAADVPPTRTHQTNKEKLGNTSNISQCWLWEYAKSCQNIALALFSEQAKLQAKPAEGGRE